MRELPASYRPDLPPFPHQRESLEAGWDAEYFAYLLEMGLGKSRVTIDNFCLLHAENLVDGLIIIAPKSVYTNWTRMDDENPGEIQKWMWSYMNMRENVRMHTHRSGKRKSDQAAIAAVMDTVSPGPRVLAVNVEAFSNSAFNQGVLDMCRLFMRHHRTMIVVDESTIIKNRQAERTRQIIKMGKLASYRRILTGALTAGSPSDAWSQFEFLCSGSLGHRAFATFQARYCVLRDVPAGGRMVKVEVGSQNLEELAARVAEHAYRRRKKDCLDLPEKVYTPPLEVEFTEEQARLYAEMRKTARTVLHGSNASADIVLTQVLRLHQIACGHLVTEEGQTMILQSNRPRVLGEQLERISDQAVIWCAYRPDVTAVCRMLKEGWGEDSIALWHGGVLQAQREAYEADFQAGRRRWMVSTWAGARGRTWTAGTAVFYFSNGHDLEVRLNSEDRTHRIGTNGTVTYTDMIVRDTVEERIVKSLRRKVGVKSAILSEGVENWI